MGTFIVLLLSVVGQLTMTVLFAQEAVTTKEGNFCRVKCTLAGMLYLCIASLLIWFLFSEGVST
ncbi:hypothetical protein [Spirosoma sp. KUDC1026]|uniref:hypothetical protein n=1 Tax=Spirosoma sp. KUDC1026 TaxID=2745947 RepID=UPI00159BB679|nr:hypothetical protein [Spirosoma sp. KUDC1026]QKZ14728.1 hypothetical protein HU175_19700 [Spirosoma sp. KUDC1026]